MKNSEFPYISSLIINDCYAYQGLRIDTHAPKGEFRHIILTGKNASGKTTILNRIEFLLSRFRLGVNSSTQGKELRNLIRRNPNSPQSSIHIW